jgi:hypothetical protein
MHDRWHETVKLRWQIPVLTQALSQNSKGMLMDYDKKTLKSKWDDVHVRVRDALTAGLY